MVGGNADAPALVTTTAMFFSDHYHLVILFYCHSRSCLCVTITFTAICRYADGGQTAQVGCAAATTMQGPSPLTWLVLARADAQVLALQIDATPDAATKAAVLAHLVGIWVDCASSVPACMSGVIA